MSYRVGVDIGGTFTDFSVLDDKGKTFLWKEDSDPVSPAQAIQRGLKAVARELGHTTEEFLKKVTLFVHGTTIATNLLIQRNGPRIGLLCTEGFRDILYTRDAFKPDRYNLRMPYPEPLVDRYLRLGVSERVNKDGEILKALDEDGVRKAAATMREAGVSSVAVAFLWSIANPNNEHRAAEILREELPGVPVLCAVDILPEIREWERTSAAVLSAYMLPGVSTYLKELEGSLKESGYGRGPLIMQINGGVASVPEILRKPVNVLASGPAAAPAVATHIGASRGLSNIVIIDMGGTSLDVCLLRDGRPAMSREISVDMQPIGVPGVDVLSVGAGGGSIAWVDSGGALRVGPQSAGSRPGPVAYDAGGTEPTVTDANIVLGYLDPHAFLGGRRVLRDDLSEAALARVGKNIGLNALETAAGVVRIVNANMVAAIQAVSVQRGIDIRKYALLSGGGAGGLHAAALARELRVPHVIIPREAGTLCAFGMTVTDVRYDEAGVCHTYSDNPDVESINAILSTLASDLRAKLRAEGFTDDKVRIEFFADARYSGQVHQLTIPVPFAEKITVGHINQAVESFHAEHKSQYTYNRPSVPVEFLHWRVTGLGLAGSTTAIAKPEAGSPPKRGERMAYDFGRRAMVSTAVYHMDDLFPGATFEGPAIVQSSTTTVIIGAGDKLTIDPDFALAIDVHIAD
ncbi:hydantoinase/oxoprolinase family protein [Rhizobium sp. 2YAF20]|uniref:hydantoinase/oxoprolinase family protein n=1 Tax=Rhizobium sp. 2YAF20 TaxID=3233027 RepID=UPI003F94DBF6